MYPARKRRTRVAFAGTRAAVGVITAVGLVTVSACSTGASQSAAPSAPPNGAALSSGSLSSAPPTGSKPAAAAPSYPPASPMAAHGPYGSAEPLRLRYPVQTGTADPLQNFGELYLPVNAIEDPSAQAGPGGGPRGVSATTPLPRKIPVVVLLHGGGWRATSGLDALTPMARSLVSHGVAVWNVEYRRIGAGGGYPLTLTDTAAAIDYLYTVRAEVAPDLDLKDLVVAGHSAGGQLAVWAAGRNQLTPGAMGSVPAITPAAVVSLSGVLDMKRAVADGNASTRAFLGIPDEGPQKFAVANPMENINPAVPVTCFNGTADQIVRAHECTAFIDALHKRGGTGEAILLPGAKHNVYLPTQAEGRYWPAVQHVILGYVDQFRSRSDR